MSDTLDKFNEKLRSRDHHLIFYLQREDLGSRLLRLQTEKMKLEANTNKLCDFLNTSEYRMLNQTERRLLEDQRNYMCGYLNTLKKRIKLIKEKLQ